MTAIAAFRINKVPILIGDVLLTTEGDKGLSIKLPGSGENTKEFSMKHSITYYPVKLSQKVTIINKTLMIATAGSVKVAIDFVRYLKADTKLNSNPTWDYTKKVFEKFKYDEKKYDFAFVCFYFNKEENVSVLTGYNVEKREVEGYEGLLVAGSGKEALIDALSGVEFRFSEEDLPNGIKAAHKVNVLLSRLWSLDITNQKNIESAFGGGYEIGTLKKRQLTKIGDILFAEIFITGILEKMLIGMNTRFAKFDYLEQDFIIRVMDLNPKQKFPIPENLNNIFVSSTDNRGFIILPIDFEGKYEFDKNLHEKLPDFNAEYCNVHLQVKAQNGQHLSSVFSEWKPQRNSPIEFKGNEIFIVPRLWNQILNCARDFLKANLE